MELVVDIGTNWVRSTVDDSFACVLEHIEQAAHAGATVAKLQLFKVDKLYSEKRAPKQYKQNKRYEFPLEWLPKVRECARKNKIKLWASVFDEETAAEAAKFISGIKIASGDLTNDDLILSVVTLAKKYGLEFAVSTGASTLGEVEHFYRLIDDKHIIPYMLHCVSLYPAKASDYNLGCMHSIADRKLGLSDHTGDVDPILIGMAIALGCELFEVHFSIEKVISPDMVVSLLPYSLSIYGREILRAVEILGNSWKHPILEEISEQYWIRRGSDGLRPKEE